MGPDFLAGLGLLRPRSEVSSGGHARPSQGQQSAQQRGCGPALLGPLVSKLSLSQPTPDLSIKSHLRVPPPSPSQRAGAATRV